MLNRAMLPGSPVRYSALAIIERCHRQVVSSSDHQPLIFDISIKSWLASMIEMQSSVGTHVTKQLKHDDPNPPIALLALPDRANYVKYITADSDIESFRDITFKPHLRAPIRILEHPVLPHLAIGNIPAEIPHLTTIGRIYLFNNNRLREFLGVCGQQLLFRDWFKLSNIPFVRRLSAVQRNTYEPHPPELGNQICPIHSSDSELLEHAILSCIVARVHCEYHKNQKGLINRAIVSMIIPDCVPRLQYPLHAMDRYGQPSKAKAALAPSIESKHYPLSIFTDGGLSTNPNLEDLLFMCERSLHKNKLTGGAIILDTSTNRALETCCIEFPQHLITAPDSFDVEAFVVLSILVTIPKGRLVRSLFYIDNQALVKQINMKPGSEDFPKDPIINTIRHLFHELQIKALWIRSHVERRKKPEDWTTEEKANYSADKLTVGDVEEVHRLFPELLYHDSNKFIQ